jgi:stage III sporulation protein SpoIIIAA
VTLSVPVIVEPFEQINTPIEALENVLEILPPWIQEHVRDYADQVEDIIMEVGRPLRFNLCHGFKRFAEIVSEDELKNLKFAFRDVAADNRTGIAGTLHRIAVRRRRHPWRGRAVASVH